MTIAGAGKAWNSWPPFWIVLGLTAILIVFETALSRRLAGGANESSVNAATGHVETGARKIGEGVDETGTGGVGHTVVEGAKAFGQSVKTFFTRMLGN